MRETFIWFSFPLYYLYTLSGCTFTDIFLMFSLCSYLFKHHMNLMPEHVICVISFVLDYYFWTTDIVSVIQLITYSPRNFFFFCFYMLNFSGSFALFIYCLWEKKCVPSFLDWWGSLALIWLFLSFTKTMQRDMQDNGRLAVLNVICDVLLIILWVWEH